MADVKFEELLEVFDGLITTEDSDESFSKVMGSLFAMEDEQFSLIAPSIIQNIMQSINNPEDKLSLVQTLNANGATAEEFTAAFVSLIEAIDAIEDLSEPKKDFLKQLFGCFVNAVNETEGIAKRYIQVPIELCHPDAKMPQYANLTDSGMDVYALDDYTIAPGETKLIPTGIKMAIPVGYEIQVRPKSGRALKTKLRIANTPGTVDAGYRDEIMVIVENIEPPIKDIAYEFNSSGQPIITSILHGSAHTIGKGEKFCQLVLMEVPKAALYQVNSVSEIGENRGGGFGSTGLV
jgi:dUTP pyrophosphatase